MTAKATATTATAAAPASSDLRQLRTTICESIATDLKRDGDLPQDDITKREVQRRVEDFLTSARPTLDDAAREVGAGRRDE